MPRRFPGIDHLLRDFSLIPGEKKGKKLHLHVRETGVRMYGSSRPILSLPLASSIFRLLFRHIFLHMRW